MFLNLIFALFILMIARTAWLLHNEKSKKGGDRKYFNGRYKW